MRCSEVFGTDLREAWRVDFNIALSGFESLIAGVRHLVDFAVCASVPGGARFVFVSSISVALGRCSAGLVSGVMPLTSHVGIPDGSTALEEPVTDACISTGTGYSESKWVSERILQTIASISGLRPLVVRCGQMTGGRSGAWNDHEWFPSLVKSSVALGKFPSVEGVSCPLCLASGIR